MKAVQVFEGAGEDHAEKIVVACYEWNCMGNPEVGDHIDIVIIFKEDQTKTLVDQTLNYQAILQERIGKRVTAVMSTPARPCTTVTVGSRWSNVLCFIVKSVRVNENPWGGKWGLLVKAVRA